MAKIVEPTTKPGDAEAAASLDTIQPGTRVQISTGEVFFVRPFLWGQLAEVTRQIVLFGIALELIDWKNLAVVMNVLARNPDAVYNLVALALEREKGWEERYLQRAEWLRALDSADGLKLSLAVVKENQRFFAEAEQIIDEFYPGKLAAYFAEAQAGAAETTGTTSSPSSPEPESPSTSSTTEQP